MEKDKSTVQGNRYGITQGLRQSMTPEKTVIDGREKQRNVFELITDLTHTIEINGGKVLDHGFYLPVPCRSIQYRDKEGKSRKTIAVNAGLSIYMLKEITELTASFPF